MVEQSDRRNLLRRRLLDDLGHPGRHLDPRAQPARQGPGPAPRLVARHLEHPDRPQLHRAVLPGSHVSAGFDIFRTSNDRQNIASYSDRSVGFALRSGWAFTEHTRQNVRYTLAPVGDLQRPALGLVDRPAAGGIVGRVGSLRNRSPGIRATRVSIRPRAGCCATTVAVGGLGGTQYYARSTVDGVIYQTIIDDFVASIGGSAGIIAPYNNSTLRLNNRFFIGGDTLRGFRVGGIGPRDANTDQFAGRQVLLHRDRGAELPARPAKGNRHPGQGLRRCRIAVGIGRRSEQVDILDSQLMRISTGIGIQWISPFGPIRVDYAIPIQKEYWTRRRTSASASERASERGRRRHEHADRQDQRGDVDRDFGRHQADPGDDPAPLSDADGRQGDRDGARARARSASRTSASTSRSSRAISRPSR